MTQAFDPLPDDPETLKAMLVAERVRSERLVQIIKELQRHRFGRRAETLPEVQLLLALDATAEAEQKSPAERTAAATRTKTGQLWAYARDDRPWGGSDPPAVAYVYAPNRKAEQPIAHLADFKGILQVDGYAGYRALAEKGMSNSPSVGRMCAAGFMNSPSAAPRRLRARRSNGSRPSTPSRRTFVAAAPKSGGLSAMTEPGRCSLISKPGFGKSSR
jgi:hypothetical protein